MEKTIYSHRMVFSFFSSFLIVLICLSLGINSSATANRIKDNRNHQTSHYGTYKSKADTVVQGQVLDNQKNH
ncbi:hypothetical protein [Pedobacter panaciterrae]